MSLDDQTSLVEFRRSTGPTSVSTKWSYFRADLSEATEIPGPDGGSGMFLQALVNHTDPDGYTLISVRYPPNSRVPRHSHDTAQIVLVLEGELRQGNRRFTAGCGYYTPPGAAYVVSAGDEGAHIVEFRHSPMTFSTDWQE
jgi:quercetin dioxygenase-like cupin family protein